MKRNVSLVRFKFRRNIIISGKIIKEMPGSVASGTHFNAILDQLDYKHALSLQHNASPHTHAIAIMQYLSSATTHMCYHDDTILDHTDATPIMQCSTRRTGQTCHHMKAMHSH